MTALLEAVPTECWVILSVATAGLILMIGLRITRRGFRFKWGKGREFECESDETTSGTGDGTSK